VHFTIGKDDYDVDYHEISPNHLCLRINGESAQIFLSPGAEGKYVFMKGRTYLVQDEDKTVPQRKRTGPQEIPKEVTPPMPSVVVRILVQEGVSVKKGQALVVVSAMKMETTLAAPFDGTVKKINTRLNAKVAPGDILVELDHGELANEQ
jgi:biotin carboxyl carrier protein